jgi:hypothetical protein
LIYNFAIDQPWEGTMTDMTVKTPWHLWAVGAVSLLWNAYGGYDYTMSMTQGAAYLASAGMTPDQVAYYEAMPVWMTAIWAVGVWGGVMG